jgi:hypothetical protein
MLRFSRVLGVFMVAALAVIAAPSRASASVLEPDAAYCDYTTMNGTASWSPGVTVAPQPNTFTMDIFVDCYPEFTQFDDEYGIYDLHLTGFAPLLSTAGTVLPGSGTISGSGPEGSISGSFTFTANGIHYFIVGNYVSDFEQHQIHLWPDLLSFSPSPTFYNFATLSSHGAFIDEQIATVCVPC